MFKIQLFILIISICLIFGIVHTNDERIFRIRRDEPKTSTQSTTTTHSSTETIESKILHENEDPENTEMIHIDHTA